MGCKIWLVQQVENLALFSLPEQYPLAHRPFLNKACKTILVVTLLLGEHTTSVHTLVGSLQGSFAQLHHNLFLGDRALGVGAVFCRDVMAAFLKAQ